ncbi:hypothetical protein SGRA_3508 [Saprospira grandis str. Lewin]|uniref:Uncharacterized protein n=1 Tax=Saprospira grandis (strain Lewin) TaxID=984262 RepID=H6L068_SAPGL|nr:hypothetical protein SGRA_3508 [Saprospira grandis str. Lewin]
MSLGAGKGRHKILILVPQLFLGGGKGEIKKGSFSGWAVLAPWAEAHACRLSKLAG